MKDFMYNNMSIEELVSNWEVDDESPSYKDTLINKLIMKVEELATEIVALEEELERN